MENNSNRTNSDGIYRIYTLSWLAYIKPVIIFLILVLIAFWFKTLSMRITITSIALVLLIYQIAFRHSIILYTDDDGVWVQRGIFPWNKGAYGVKWRDIDEAVFFTGFISWAFKSYAIRVGHRYTKDSELYLKHVRLGNEAVEHINDLHKLKFFFQ